MAGTGYQLDENAAELYEKHTVPTGAQPAAERLLEHVQLRSTDRVLDAACGTGIVIRLIAQSKTQIAQATGLDLNESMLAVARSVEPAADFPISWKQGDLCAIPFTNDAFDIVLCNHGFQFVPDKSAALHEIKRVLTKGGRLGFSVWSAEAPMMLAIADSVRRHIGEELVKSVLAPFSYRDAMAIENLLMATGFSEITIKNVEFSRNFPASPDVGLKVIERSAYANEVAAERDEVRAAIASEIFESMQDYRQGDELVEPLQNFVVQACAPGVSTAVPSRQTKEI